MPLGEFSTVRLLTDRCADKGVGVGSICVILDVYDVGYDVEFSRPEDGSTNALLFLTQSDIEPATEVSLRSQPASV